MSTPSQLGGTLLQDLRTPSKVYWLIFRLLRPLLGRFGRLDVIGKDNLPAVGAVIVSNHVGWVDPLWLIAAAWPRPVFQMAKQELFRNGLIGWVIRQMGGFPVNRASPSTSSLKIPLSIIKQKGLVVVFPGGRRATEIEVVKRGAATIAALARCPVVVARYQGPTTLQFKHLFRRPRVTVSFAAPFQVQPSELGDVGNKAFVRHISEAIEERLR